MYVHMRAAGIYALVRRACARSVGGRQTCVHVCAYESSRHICTGEKSMCTVGRRAADLCACMCICVHVCMCAYVRVCMCTVGRWAADLCAGLTCHQRFAHGWSNAEVVYEVLCCLARCLRPRGSDEVAEDRQRWPGYACMWVWVWSWSESCSPGAVMK